MNQNKIPTGSFLKTNGQVLPPMDAAEAAQFAGLLGEPTEEMTVALAAAMDAGAEDVNAMLDTFVDATKQFIIGGGMNGGISIDSLAQFSEDMEPIQEQGGSMDYDETIRDGNNKAHRSIAKRKATAKAVKASKKRNRKK